MRLQSTDAFSSYHPAVNFLYFGLVLFFTMCFLHPACLLLSLAAALAHRPQLLILDEACAAWQLGAVDREMLRQAVLGRPEHCEVVLTGREPADWMKEAAHYSTEMVCHSHPFDRGTQARPGIEF